ncbi:MAG: ATP-binding protein [Methylococcales bacterium]|nr:ATP-binding protein [Methylococcales bacterium]
MLITHDKDKGVTLTITSTAEAVSSLGEALQALCLNASGSEACAYAVQLATVEAVNNVIAHAYNNQIGNDIVVHWSQYERRIHIEIIDYGQSMSYLPIAELPDFDAENGRGWWIINASVDEYHYKVVECLERERLYKPSGEGAYAENLSVQSHRNVLTLIKQF